MAIKVDLMREEIVMENILRTDKLTSKETNFIIGIIIKMRYRIADALYLTMVQTGE